jgi:hypothetical protein
MILGALAGGEVYALSLGVPDLATHAFGPTMRSWRPRRRRSRTTFATLATLSTTRAPTTLIRARRTVVTSHSSRLRLAGSRRRLRHRCGTGSILGSSLRRCLWRLLPRTIPKQRCATPATTVTSKDNRTGVLTILVLVTQSSNKAFILLMTTFTAFRAKKVSMKPGAKIL